MGVWLSQGGVDIYGFLAVALGLQSIRGPGLTTINVSRTWQDGISELHRSRYTNVLRLARTIHHEDERFQPPIPQVVYYQSGIGTEKNFYSEYIEGTTGGSLADKVEEAYAFIAHNYNPGDEIFLFGFSRGAYTARMVAMLIGEFGVLDRKDMDHFAKIFICYQKLGKTNNKEERQRLHEDLESWRRHDASGKTRIDCDGDTFTIKCLGVFDTVGSVGLPETLTLRARSPKARNLLGMKDPILGEHVERAYQALALNEMRRDFRCNKFEQTEQGRLKKQVLEQCWFAGSHSDIGGGYEEHDLADLSLIWMASRIEDILGLDVKYLSKLPKPVALGVSSSLTSQNAFSSIMKEGIFVILPNIQRPIPTATNDVTHEYIHPSVLQQEKLSPYLANLLKDHPAIVGKLEPLEEGFKRNWPFNRDSKAARTYSSGLDNQIKGAKDSPAPPTVPFILSASRFRSSISRSLSLSSSSKHRDLRTYETVVREERKSVVVAESEDRDITVVRVTETTKLKKIRRQSTPLPSIAVVSGV
ncbi:hypothetical protein D9611_003173 [Ephemerocybe angulata]|uniref:T6SS Phospholipase effector Tle1-like catalytic domain-containing protein n=1 Tax=Ephemerocybe angulata TaxID=980116 RepID=A0A8H5FHJ2_9AGAR|nr:hypothetical protein D9611_003173 [Tulosesus angulatus]